MLTGKSEHAQLLPFRQIRQFPFMKKSTGSLTRRVLGLNIRHRGQGQTEIVVLFSYKMCLKSKEFLLTPKIHGFTRSDHVHRKFRQIAALAACGFA